VVTVQSSAFIIGPESQIERVSSTQPLQPLLNKVLRASVLLATVRDSGEIKFCSGSLISPEKPGAPHRVVTNHHCFTEKKTSTEIISEACHKTKVFFGFNEANQFQTKEVPCLKGTLKLDARGDLASFQLAGTIPENTEPLEIWEEESLPKEGVALIVHYPNLPEHMKEIPGQFFSLPAASITSNNCTIKGRFLRNEWPIADVLKYSLRHTCDLVDGSSGSALIDVTSGKIIGINWGGVTFKFAEKEVQENAATLAPYLHGFLNGNSDEVALRLAANVSSSAWNQSEDQKAKQLSSASTQKKEKHVKEVIKGCGTVKSFGGETPPTWLSSLFFIVFPFLIWALVYASHSGQRQKC
jgi:hypothetical protein